MTDIFSKLRPLGEVAGVVRQLKSEGKKVVLCHGVFDLLHIGHIRHFRQARQMGDILFVTVTPDRFADKGPQHPAFNELLRAEAIASLDTVDLVAINESETAEETLRMVRPDVFVKGSEFRKPADDPTGKMLKEARVVEEIGSELAFTEDIVFSSSNLLNTHFQRLPDEMSRFLGRFAQYHDLEEFLGVLDSIRDLRVLVVGDTILDEYQFTEVLGRSSKDPILATRVVSKQVHGGGALAIAGHLAGFVEDVHLLTVIGEADNEEGSSRALLQPRVTPHFIVSPGACTTIKTRFLDQYSLNKLFELYIMDNEEPTFEQDNQMKEWLHRSITDFDLVIAADFGHGAISIGTAEFMAHNAPFLCAMTQFNAGNKGQCTIKRYPRADFACIADREVRLASRNRHCDLEQSVQEIARSLGCSKFVMTRGNRGCVTWSKDEGFGEVPAFANKVVDRVGAGDAFLSVAAPAAYLGKDDLMIGFLGNIAGALAVSTLGNSTSIDAMALRKWVTALLK